MKIHDGLYGICHSNCMCMTSDAFVSFRLSTKFIHLFIFNFKYGCASKRLSVIQRPWKVQFIDCICLKPTIIIILSET